MIRNNYHTHTFRCGHAIGSDEEYVLEAIALGLNTLGFSDHVMLPGIRQENVRGDYENSEGYFQSIRSLQSKYKDRINILLGYEAEAFPEFFDYYRKLLDEKIEDAKSDSNKEAKYKLMRQKNALEKERNRLRYNLRDTRTRNTDIVRQQQ